MANVRKVTKAGLDSLIAKGLLNAGTTYQIIDDNNKLIIATSKTEYNDSTIVPQYIYVKDPETGLKYRIGVRSGVIVYDEELIEGGFSGDKGEGWDDINNPEPDPEPEE